MLEKRFKKLKDYVWLSNGFIGKTFKCEMKDFESFEKEVYTDSLESFFKSLKVGEFVSFHLFSHLSYNCDIKNKRSKDLQEIGFVRKKLFFNIFSKKEVSLFHKEEGVLEKVHKINKFENKFLKLKPVFVKDFFKVLFDFKKVKLEAFGLSNEREYLASFKMNSLSNSYVSLENLIFLTEKLPLPFEYHIKLKKIDPLKQKYALSRVKVQERAGQSHESFLRYKASEEALCEMEFQGSEFFEFEVHVILRRDCEKDLREDISASKNTLSLLGEFKMEKWGAFKSFLSLLPGESFHVPLILQNKELLNFLPLLTRGSLFPLSSGLLFHRIDHSLDLFNPFHKKYDNYCGIIIGKSGRGKSVFTNLLLESLCSDSHLKVILVDVRGSYTKRVEKLKGQAFHISLEKPKGFDPFQCLNSKRESVEMLMLFLKTLIGDEMSFVEEGELEKKLISYSQTTRPCFHEFVKVLKNFKKKALLERWTKGRLRENIFSSKRDFELKDLNYFNFQEILTAEDKNIAKAVIASVMCDFSHKLLVKEPYEKLLFIVDETPFFIRNSFETFKLLSKNVRKLNASLILIAQSSSDLVVREDKSLLDNSEFKVFFSLDDKEKEFQERFFLKNEELEILKTLRSQKGEYSQFFLKDSLCSKVGFLRLSDKEYIESTTNPRELIKLKTLRSLYPFIGDENLSQVFRFLEGLS